MSFLKLLMFIHFLHRGVLSVGILLLTPRGQEISSSLWIFKLSGHLIMRTFGEKKIWVYSLKNNNLKFSFLFWQTQNKNIWHKTCTVIHWKKCSHVILLLHIFIVSTEGHVVTQHLQCIPNFTRIRTNWAQQNVPYHHFPHHNDSNYS